MTKERKEEIETTFAKTLDDPGIQDIESMEFLKELVRGIRAEDPDIDDDEFDLVMSIINAKLERLRRECPGL